MTNIKASDKIDLEAILSKIDIRVPARTEGREVIHCEKWAICRFLATLSTCDRLIFPIELTKSERPDFV